MHVLRTPEGFHVQRASTRRLCCKILRSDGHVATNGPVEDQGMTILHDQSLSHFNGFGTSFPKRGDSDGPPITPQWIGHAPDADNDGRPRHGYHSAYAASADAEKWVAFDLDASVTIDAVTLHPVFPLHEGGFKEQWRGTGLYFPRELRIEVADQPDFAEPRVIARWCDEQSRRESDFDDEGRFLGWHVEQPLEEPVRIALPPTPIRHLRIVVTRLGGYYSSECLKKNEPKRFALALAAVEIWSGAANVARRASVRVADVLPETFPHALRFAPKFINDGHTTPLPPATLFRKEFTLPERPVRGTLEATARGVYCGWLNGQPVSPDRFAPEWTSYARRLLVQSYDVTALLRAGPNALALAVGDGWMFGTMTGGQDVRHPWGCHHQFLGRLRLEYADGRHEVINTDDSWRSSTAGPWRRTDLYIGEVFDQRLSVAGWDQPRFRADDWLPVCVRPLDDQPVAPQRHPGIRVSEEIPCRSITERAPGVYLLDFGVNLLGVCRLRLRGRAGQSIRIQHVQELNADGSPQTFSLSATMQRDYVIPATDAELVYEPRFTIHGFRYVEVSGVTAPPAEATALFMHSAAQPVGKLSCDNDVLNRLMAAADRTIRSNLLSVSTDCVARERFGWPTSEPGYSAAMFQCRLPEFYGKWLQDFDDGFHESAADASMGYYPLFAPPMPKDLGTVHQPGNASWFSFAWSDSPLALAWQHWLHYADPAPLTGLLPRLRGLMATLDRLVPATLDEPPRVQTFFGDWLDATTLHDPLWTDAGYLPDPARQTGYGVDKQFFAYAFLAHDYDLAARLFAALGASADASRWRERFEFLKAYFVQHFFDATGKATSHCQGAYALALYFELLSADKIAAALGWLRHAVAMAGQRLATGFVTTPMLLHALSRYGEHALACRLALRAECPGYGYMIAQGATTIWERWDRPAWAGKAYMNDSNHRDFAAVADWIWQWVVGLQPDPAAPGFASFTVAPQVGGPIAAVSATHHSQRGPIVVNWETSGQRFRLDLTTPAQATIILPSGYRRGLTVNDRPHDGGAIQLAPGRYRLESYPSDVPNFPPPRL